MDDFKKDDINKITEDNIHKFHINVHLFNQIFFGIFDRGMRLGRVFVGMNHGQETWRLKVAIAGELASV